MPEENKYKDIELRSEKVRKIVGKVPPLLLRIGIFVVAVILLLILALAYFIPYPEYKNITVRLYSDTIIPDTISGVYGVCSIPCEETGRIRKGQKVIVTLEGKDEEYNPKTFLINGYINKIYPFIDSDSITHKESYRIEISGFPDSLRIDKNKWFLFPDRRYNGKILLSDKSVLKKILRI